jgi:hypothetical protein
MIQNNFMYSDDFFVAMRLQMVEIFNKQTEQV